MCLPRTQPRLTTLPAERTSLSSAEAEVLARLAEDPRWQRIWRRLLTPREEEDAAEDGEERG